MTKITKRLLSAILITVFMALSFISVSAETVAENDEHGLTLTLPEGYLLLDADTAEDNVELIESLGYSLSSFKSYLKPPADGSAHALFLGVEPSTKAQLSVKSWSTEFSKKIGDFSFLEDEAIEKVAKELVTAKGTSYKTVSANGMRLIETRLTSKDSGGAFCSVQYVTICNGAFYSLSFTFSGGLDDGKVQTAWNTLSTFRIESNLDGSVWDAGTILLIVLLSVITLAALITAGIIIFTIIRDVKNRRNDANENGDYIERRR